MKGLAFALALSCSTLARATPPEDVSEVSEKQCRPLGWIGEEVGVFTPPTRSESDAVGVFVGWSGGLLKGVGAACTGVGGGVRLLWDSERGFSVAAVGRVNRAISQFTNIYVQAGPSFAEGPGLGVDAQFGIDAVVVGAFVGATLDEDGASGYVGVRIELIGAIGLGIALLVD